MERIILFDGVCNLCSQSVQFILKRDTKHTFYFASLQGKLGQKILKEHNLPANINSFILIENGKVYLESTAALKVCRHLKGGWKALTVLRLVPPPIRNFFYQLIALNRYRWFGKNESCMLPAAEWKHKFLD